MTEKEAVLRRARMIKSWSILKTASFLLLERERFLSKGEDLGQYVNGNNS